MKDEFTRNYCTFSVAKSAPTTVPICQYDAGSSSVRFPDLDESTAAHSEESLLKQNSSGDEGTSQFSSSRILHHYHPGYCGWLSTYKRSPPETKNLLGDRPSTDSYLFVKVNSIRCRYPFEPLFGSLCLYYLNGEEFHRVSESFYFDLTSPEHTKRFPEIYQATLEEIPDISKDDHVRQDPATILKTCVFSVPADLKCTYLFLVWQLQKVLTADTEKALAPYGTSRTNLPETSRHDEAIKRLYKYRQALGFGVARVYNEQRQVIDAPTITIQGLATKTPFSDAILGSVSQ